MKFHQDSYFSTLSNYRHDRGVQLLSFEVDEEQPQRHYMGPYEDPFDIDKFFQDDHWGIDYDANIETPLWIPFVPQPLPQEPKPEPQDQRDEDQPEEQPDSLVREAKPQSPSEAATQAKKVQGYPSKNFLQAGKKPHLEYIEKVKGAEFIKNNKILNQIKKKSGISMKDYQTIYKMYELRQIWPEFFKKKVLHRYLILTRLEKEQRLRFQCLLFRYQEAFRSGKFDYVMPKDMKTWKLFQKIEKVKPIRKQKKQPYSTQWSEQSF